ncbi:MAG: DUF1284 domain-containing protein [Candidatus Omnitrophica bacterium]|nr:DUF1284 domain-containing protein [Candidatus Omnitrophota bacterium]
MEILKVRPYQLLCLICSFGENGCNGPKDKKLKELLEKIREFSSRPIMLTCNAGDVFSYQDPGIEEDTEEGSEFNRTRDLEILHKLDLMPGAILPARIILFRIFDKILTSSGVCGQCAKAKKGYYEKALRDFIAGSPDWNTGDTGFYKLLKEGKCSVLNERKETDFAEEKKKSIAAMYEAEEISVRPHILLCAVEQYAEGIRPPFTYDNLPEMMQHIIKNPDLKIKLVPDADWMMCAPCPGRDPGLNACIQAKGHGGLTSQLRDLRVLQKLGLKYGQSVKAKDLYKLIFERIKTTNEICTLDGVFPSVWEDKCGTPNAEWTREGKENELYKKGRELLMVDLGIEPEKIINGK